MRIQIMALLCALSFNLHASSDKEMKKLFENYDQVMKYHKVHLVEEVFTEKFLEDNGGKEEFIAKVKSVPKEKKGLKSLLRKWKENRGGKFFSAKVKSEDSKSHEAEFIIKEEKGKLKIDGTISDG